MIAIGTRVKDTGGDGEWATIKEVSGDRFRVDWDCGEIGHAWWRVDEWLFDQPNDPRRPESPVRTVIVPGIYGHIEVADKLEPDSVIVRIGPYTPMTADELEAAARTLTELAEALRAQ